MKVSYFFSRLSVLPWALLTALTLSGCGSSDPTSPKFVVAKGKGVRVTRGDIEVAKARFFSQHGAVAFRLSGPHLVELERQLAQQLVLQALLKREADKLKLPDPAEKVAAEIERMKAQLGGEKGFHDRLKQTGVTAEIFKEELLRQARVQEVLRVRLSAIPEPSSESISRFYAENPARSLQPAATRVSHVMVLLQKSASPTTKADKRKLIDAARARISKGEDFAKVAAAVSEDSATAKNGGDLGFIVPGRMSPAFDKAVLGTRTGAVSPVFETPLGYHFLKVMEHRPSSVLPLDKVRPQIAAHLKNLQSSENIKAYFRKLETDARVVYHLEGTAPLKSNPVIPRSPPKT